MKNLFFTLGLTLLGTFAFANHSVEVIDSEEDFGCWEVADMAANHVSALMEDLKMPLSYEETHNVWVMYYEACIN